MLSNFLQGLDKFLRGLIVLAAIGVLSIIGLAVFGLYWAWSHVQIVIR